MKTHYDVLELKKNCTSEEIKNSYVRLSLKYHPDRNKSNDAQEKFVKVNEAYSVLGKPNSRVRYDESLRCGQAYHSRENTEFRKTYDYAHANNFRQNYPKYSHDPNLVRKTKLGSVLLCCVCLLIGAGLQIRIIYNSIGKRRSREQTAALLLEAARKRAKEMGREATILGFANGTLRTITVNDIEEDLKKKRSDIKR